MLNFMTSILSPTEDTCLKSLASLAFPAQDKEQRSYILKVVEGIADGLTVEELVKLTSLILLRRFESGKSPAEVFASNSLAYHLTKAVLIKLKYPVGENGSRLLDLLIKMTHDTEFFMNRKKGNLKGNHFGAELLKELKNVPSLVITLLTPFFHALSHAAQSEVKENFRVAFAKAFFFDAMLDTPEPEGMNISLDTKMALGQNAQWMDLFPEFTTKLEAACKAYQPVQVSKGGLLVTICLSEKISQIAMTYHRALKLRADLVILDKIFRNMASTFNQPESDWHLVYQGVSIEFTKLLAELDGAPLKTSEATERIYNEIVDRLSQNLKRVINNPLTDFTALVNLIEEIDPLLQRVRELAAVFSVIAQTAVKDSPAHQFYAGGVEILYKHLEASVVMLIYNVGIVDQAQRKEMLKDYHTELSRLLTPYVNDTLDELTLLHQLVKQTFSVNQENEAQRALFRTQLKERIERLLLEGCDVKATTTNYERKGMFAFLTKKPPLTVTELAELYGNGDLLLEAIQSASEKQARADLEAIWALHPSNQGSISGTGSSSSSSTLTATSSTTAAALDSTLATSASGEPLFAIAAAKAAAVTEATAATHASAAISSCPVEGPPVLGWQRSGSNQDLRGLKRQLRTPTATPEATPTATPGTTPRNSTQLSVGQEKKRVLSDGGQMDSTEMVMDAPVPLETTGTTVTVRRIVRKPGFGASNF